MKTVASFLCAHACASGRTLHNLGFVVKEFLLNSFRVFAIHK